MRHKNPAYQNKVKFGTVMDKDLLVELKILALKTGKTLYELLEEGARMVLEKYEEKQEVSISTSNKK